MAIGTVMIERSDGTARQDKTEWEVLAEGARQRVVERDGKQLRILELTDAFVEDDWCTRAHVGYVLEGVLELTFPDRVERFGAGDGFTVEATFEMRHKAKSVSGRVLLFLSDTPDA